jgi:hypothetical protein
MTSIVYGGAFSPPLLKAMRDRERPSAERFRMA